MGLCLFGMAEVVTSAFLKALRLISPKKLTVKYDDVSSNTFLLDSRKSDAKSSLTSLPRAFFGAFFSPFFCDSSNMLDIPGVANLGRNKERLDMSTRIS